MDEGTLVPREAMATPKASITPRYVVVKSLTQMGIGFQELETF